MLSMLNNLLVKISFWDQLKEEFEDIWSAIMEFFTMIKSVTYDVLANAIGGDFALMLVIAVGVIGIMVISVAVINR